MSRTRCGILMPLRRAGTLPSAEFHGGPGSAEHYASLRRRNAPRPGHDSSKLNLTLVSSQAGIGAGDGISFASLRRFWAVAARRNSS
jgi:hypothetical protein